MSTPATPKILPTSISKKINNVNFYPKFGCGGIILLEINIIIKKESEINNK
jgi:hypothetical protein